MSDEWQEVLAMTTEPHLPVDLLAQLHADNVPPDQAEDLWAQARADPQAMAVIDALEAVRARLAQYAVEDFSTPIPADVAARLEQSLLAATAAAQPSHSPDLVPAAVASLDAARARKAKRARYFLAAAAVAIVGGTAAVVALNVSGGHSGTDSAATPPAAGALDLGSGGLSTNTVMAAMHNKIDYGPLADPSVLAACLRDVGADRAVLGSMNVVYHGADAVLVLVAGPAAKPRGTITALIVPVDCPAGTPALLAHADF
jgi:hypothetical protein